MAGAGVRIAYKPVALLLSASAGLVAGLVFKRVWRAASREGKAPRATDEDRGWAEVLAAAAVQGAIFTLVKAAVDRAGATGVKRLTGTWPA
jgi:uncharacterized protein DUF4235